MFLWREKIKGEKMEIIVVTTKKKLTKSIIGQMPKSPEKSGLFLFIFIKGTQTSGLIPAPGV